MQKPDIYPNSSALCTAAAEFWLTSYTQAIAAHGQFYVALSGGTTPKRLYEKLAAEPYRNKINWQDVHIFFGDERFVALDHPDSNFNMANTALLSQVDIPRDNIYPVPVDTGSAEVAADLYAKTLKNTLPDSSTGIPQFDLVLLGLGPDGHTASLFPGTSAVEETEKFCSAVYVEKFDSWRVSITFPIINAARDILLLTEGSGKHDIIEQLTNDNIADNQYPIQRVKQTNFHWFADQAAMQGN